MKIRNRKKTQQTVTDTVETNNTPETKRQAIRGIMRGALGESMPIVGIALAGVILRTSVSFLAITDHPGPRLLVDEHVPASWVTNDCPVGWDKGRPANPVALAKSFRSLGVTIREDRINEGLPQDIDVLRNPIGDTREEYLRNSGLRMADSMLNGPDLDRPVQVACEDIHGNLVTTQLAETALISLRWSGTNVDPLTGIVTPQE